MANRISALDGHVETGLFGALRDVETEAQNRVGITLSLLQNLALHQLAAWPDTIEQVSAIAMQRAGNDKRLMSPTPTEPIPALETEHLTVLRVEPLKWWLIGGTPIDIDPQIGTSLDLSQSRTHLRVAGPDSTTLLNRFLPLDLREKNFPTGSVASSAIQHIGITLWRHELGYDLLIPRGFALSIWQLIFASSLQFGLQVTQETT